MVSTFSIFGGMLFICPSNDAIHLVSIGAALSSWLAYQAIIPIDYYYVVLPLYDSFSLFGNGLRNFGITLFIRMKAISK